MTEKLPSTPWVIFSKVLPVKKLCSVQFVKCPTKRKIRKDICPVNKTKLFPALHQPRHGIKPGTKGFKNYYARASHKINCAKLAPQRHFITLLSLIFFLFFFLTGYSPEEFWQHEIMKAFYWWPLHSIDQKDSSALQDKRHCLQALKRAKY